ncbi:hypothetical protein ACJ73_09218 [Blastomyces percursus]|uniref:Uncharacterized protein n=1 Tax=Blastomyces percursus TaxID=1658174 RepID=A0A1J9PBA5_9EURO|nr:hypothetical protein ACJ73_09218 [Blastomyces percursus]
MTGIDDADGLLLTDDSMAMLSFASNVPVKQVVLDISLPSMIMCSKVKMRISSYYGKALLDSLALGYRFLKPCEQF